MHRPNRPMQGRTTRAHMSYGGRQLERKCGEGAYMLGRAHELGQGVQQNLSAAVDLYKHGYRDAPDWPEAVRTVASLSRSQYQTAG